jgi:hypothetical protein
VRHAGKVAADNEARLVVVTAYEPHGDELVNKEAQAPEDIRWALTDRVQAEELVDDDELVDDALVDDDDALVDDDLVDDVLVVDEVVEEVPRPAKTKGDDDDSEEDDLEEPDPDDVEADLTTILKDRIAAAEEEEDEDEDEVVDTDDRGDSNKIQPRRPGEFVCQSCFLLKPQTQLADAKRKLCADCV